MCQNMVVACLFLTVFFVVYDARRANETLNCQIGMYYSRSQNKPGCKNEV